MDSARQPSLVLTFNLPATEQTELVSTSASSSQSPILPLATTDCDQRSTDQARELVQGKNSGIQSLKELDLNKMAVGRYLIPEKSDEEFNQELTAKIARWEQGDFSDEEDDSCFYDSDEDYSDDDSSSEEEEEDDF